MGRDLVLIIEDEPLLLLSVGRYLRAQDFDTEETATCSAAEASFRARRPDVVLADYDLPDGNALELLARLRNVDAGVPMVILTGGGSIDLAVRAIKEGAEQFLTKPVDLPALAAVLKRVAEARRSQELQGALNERQAHRAPDPFIGESAAIRALREEARRVAAADGPVLILGETGSGKGVLARWLHANGPRAAQRFVDLNCAGLSRELLESELFGHERGAFTGAQAAKPGMLEVADRGSLFLDEIGDMDLQVQPRLLKALEEKRFRRLGDVRDRVVDVRLMAATHHDLPRAVAEKQFRQDLYYRLSVLPLRLPPLRERTEDVPALAQRLLGGGVSLSREAEAALAAYSWPGNVRELRNVLERARVLSQKPVLEAEDLRLDRRSGSEPDELLTLEELERRHIERALQRAGGKVTRAAEMLGIARSSLYQKLQRYRIEAKEEP
jgi:DNA-binding NtrC family response regulator